MKVALANDHRGINAIEQIKAIISQLGFECIDYSINADQPVDYPDMAYAASTAVAQKKADRAILVCGTGIGMSIAANKVKGIRAALCYDELAAKLSREHNDANVLCLSGDLIGPTMMRKIVETWLTTEFVAGRHLRRVRKIQAIEEGMDPRQLNTEA
ncbi:MAG TPA: ribose 5-phosphate isomerase B [Anaerohalosphaeraceae bacterium]|nr:ribose 5-phosphate isomerase B [Phycisphaerae bacterium]HOK95239.1 ribose 5-phosphate isomerase B [Anaerohalosphaeraceae bacterium]HOM75097.1 ribose 5-phosphate isomerase B [Anaerohalosphaeraceae bacterium]HPC63148.1 ribose 5-phosphate isomerase B [Anaerohalosphaeraceae bacterium]HPO68937.1 ribose 5-phosphate isomerase B [Anaerohalosphaeraceae bacterium]